MQQNQSNQLQRDGAERRAYPRCLPAMEVRELVPGKQEYHVRSVSAGGMRCRAEVFHQPGVMVVLEINLKNGLMPFSAPARVVRASQSSEGCELSFQFLMPQVQMIPYLPNT